VPQNVLRQYESGQGDAISAAIICCVQCCMACVQQLVEYFNRYAMIESVLPHPETSRAVTYKPCACRIALYGKVRVDFLAFALS